jgi:hypothetical protein
MRTIVATDRLTYWGMERKRRDSRVFGFVPMGTCVTTRSLLPAWMIVSSVYVKRETTLSLMAASRL